MYTHMGGDITAWLFEELGHLAGPNYSGLEIEYRVRYNR